MTTALSLSPETAPHDLVLGAVTLSSRDPDRLIPFYRDGVGLEVLATGETSVLGAGGRPLVEIARRPDAARAPVRAPGLFHMALRVPDRASLAARLMALHHMGLRMGASDHLVSEALYVDDPDGNGIEIYRDRPAAEWPRSPDGTIAMATLPLDLAALAREAPPAARPAPAGTDMGHVHLKVADLEAARRFWVDTVGLAIMARYPGALFVSADGYHHHLGLNTWQSSGAPAPAAGTAGLDHFTVRLPADAIEALAGRLAAAGVACATTPAGDLSVTDPSGNRALFRPA
ncbi:VOC family protein [Xanthobacter autotrophicus]|uniref:VOC family protein n=1 Tax=Xanthobacter TaxID=279 RepID=UPI0024AB48D7|nr:VOC family protein [Xanthobacter autotrophicus]MDI4666290.1 VOC family protein [Xanthobacter autotrophicus]